MFDHFSAVGFSKNSTFNARFFHADTKEYDRASQTDNAIPLALGMAPQGHGEEVLTNLVDIGWPCLQNMSSNAASGKARP